MPSDYGHEQTDKELKKLESKLTKEYKQAANEVEKKLKNYLEKFEKKDSQMQAKVKSGDISAQEYAEWRKNQMLTGKRWEQMRDTLASDLARVDEIAAGMINDSLPNAYAQNMNYGTYEMEAGANVDTSFTLYDKSTVQNLMEKDPHIIPQARVDIPKDQLWNRRKLTSAITQGILQGESIPKIANRLRSVTDMDRKAAIRNARTYTTAAENKGRVDSYERAKEMGISAKQQWMATLDERTRAEHRHLDGQIREVGEDFEVDGYTIKYPGDPDAEPEMIYNCRCTLVAHFDKYGKDIERNFSKIGDMTYDEWKKAKDKVVNSKEILHTNNRRDYEELKLYAKTNGIKYKEVNELERSLSEDEIVRKLAGGDMTDGSCASLSLAYVANKHGLDVTDYRGGNSRKCFSRLLNYDRMLKTANPDQTTYMVKKEAKETAKILRELPKDKEYVLVAGKHASIVRNSEEFGLQYMELQSAKHSGWNPFELDLEMYGIKHHLSTEEILKERFGCLKSEKRIAGDVIKHRVIVADVDSFKSTEEFKEMLGYINTDSDKQQKGEKGSVK